MSDSLKWIVAVFLCVATHSAVADRVKDLTSVGGVRSNYASSGVHQPIYIYNSKWRTLFSCSFPSHGYSQPLSPALALASKIERRFCF